MLRLGRQGRWQGGLLLGAVVVGLVVYTTTLVFTPDAEFLKKAMSSSLLRYGLQRDDQKAWLARRKALQAENGANRKVLLYAYMRSGSTLLYNIFNVDRRAMAWYEPMAGLYGHMYGLPRYRNYLDLVFTSRRHVKLRQVSEVELESLSAMLDGVFTCDLARLPEEILANTFIARSSVMRGYAKCLSEGQGLKWEHECQEKSGIARFCGGPNLADKSNATYPFSLGFAEKNSCPEYLTMARHENSNTHRSHGDPAKLAIFKEYVSCIEDLRRRTLSCLDSSKLVQTCKSRTIRTAKVLRIKLPYIEPIVQALPDFYLVFYIRDPRAIINSRFASSSSDELSKRWAVEVMKLCTEIRQDLEHLSIIQDKYPGLVLRMRYEDLVRSPNETLDQLYGHFEKQPLEDLRVWLHSTMHASDDNSDHGVKRKNATAVINKWRSNYPDDVIDDVSHSPECRPVLAALNYL